MNRVLVLGSAGSGKSTLSQQLGGIFKLPVIHLDKYYWKPNWEPTPNEEWDKRVEYFTMQEHWIIDGNYSRTLDKRLERADLIIFLDMSRWLCLYRILKRRIMYHKKTRPDMNEECPEKFDFEFIKWVWNYRKRSRVNTLNKLAKVKDEKEIIIVKNRKQAAELILRLDRSKGELII
ncbi:DNA topology modulation protein [Paenibacillus wynnii]|uniref:DNA topology modulation protein n=1 Tax=Paenibacillus wynnii TaxID=268407 RepID=UPI00278D8906|nr:DNA topology modulation protein [Paenibacillus wynnii]MDQ0195572.1 adenylate kinase family enzyme [Paenibacillus wynnii]